MIFHVETIIQKVTKNLQMVVAIHAVPHLTVSSRGLMVKLSAPSVHLDITYDHVTGFGHKIWARGIHIT